MRIFFIFEFSRPPNLNISGLPVKFMIVDSIPTLHVPPSRTNFTLFPNSSLTSDAFTELSLVEIFALGAAIG